MGGEIVTSTIYRPGDEKAFQYSAGVCTSWEFKSRIDGFPPTFGFGFNQTDKVGDEYSKTFYDPTGKFPLYRLDVWFKGEEPVQYHNTADEGSIVGGVKAVSKYNNTIKAKDRFDIPKEWGCKAEALLAAPKPAPFAPTLPSAYEMIIDWDSEAAGKTYHYTHKRSYDVAQQLYRDVDDLPAGRREGVPVLGWRMHELGVQVADRR